jgi:hypothetical protein
VTEVPAATLTFQVYEVTSWAETRVSMTCKKRGPHRVSCRDREIASCWEAGGSSHVGGRAALENTQVVGRGAARPDDLVRLAGVERGRGVDSLGRDGGGERENGGGDAELHL